MRKIRSANRCSYECTDEQKRVFGQSCCTILRGDVLVSAWYCKLDYRMISASITYRYILLIWQPYIPNLETPPP